MLGSTFQVPLSLLEKEQQVFPHQCQGGHARSFLMTGTRLTKAEKMSKFWWSSTELL